MKRQSAGMLLSALAAGAWLSDTPRVQSQPLPVPPECSTISNPTTFDGTALDTGTEGKLGVGYDLTPPGRLSLVRAGAFQNLPLFLTGFPVFAAAADFDGDGYGDFVAGDTSGVTRVYRNLSSTNLGAPTDWDAPGFTLTPSFGPSTTLDTNASGNFHMLLAAGDFNGDGRADVFRADSTLGTAPVEASVWLTTSIDGTGNPVFGARADALAAGTVPADLGTASGSGSTIAVVDYNRDRKLDLLVANADTSGGSIRLFLNACTLAAPTPPAPPAPTPLPCSDAPTFRYAGPLLEDLGVGVGQTPVFAFADFDLDGYGDLAVSGAASGLPAGQRLRLFKGNAHGSFDAPRSIPFVGGANVVLASDFTRDGRPDLLLGTDEGFAANHGGQALILKNDGTNAVFSGPPDTVAAHGTPLTDYDFGIAVNYDNDPDGTIDFITGDGNAGGFSIFPNRPSSQFVPCGEVYSAPLNLATLQDTKMAVTTGRLFADVSLNGGTVQFYMSGEDFPDWVPAFDCNDGSGELCARFPEPSGRSLRWKARLCTTNPASSPHINRVDVYYEYFQSTEHYTAGSIVLDGISYTAGFSQPGDRGRLYATSASYTANAGGTAPIAYWEGSAKLDAMDDAERKIYTASPDGSSRIDFLRSNASSLLATLAASNTAQVESVVDWARSARFGAGTAIDGLPLTRLGSVVTSTPAVLSKPGVPVWYTFASGPDRSAVDAFLSANAGRKPLVLFGAKDGMIHALHSDAKNMTDPRNGTEAWAFLPAFVARNMVADYTSSLLGDKRISVYPDGSPTLEDVEIGGTLRTVAIVGGGKGGKGIVALDVTQTVDPNTGTVSGPQPLWHITPGGADSGQGLSRTAIARVDIGGDERFVAITGSGIDYGDAVPTDPDIDPATAPNLRGRIVSAYDMATGALLWKFQTVCPLTSEITVFETDDDDDAADTPTVDGFMDRAVFGDKCGFVYKVDPGVDLAGGWNVNTGMGTIPALVVGGQQLFALFATASTPAPLNNQRPITGAVAARADETSRVVLFFGTGGLEEAAPSNQNALFAIYADDGSLVEDSPVAGACFGTGPVLCEKFYGGVVANDQQILIARSLDAEVGTGGCANTKIQGIDIVNFGTIEFSTDIVGSLTGSLFGYGGALYVTTSQGQAIHLGEPQAPTAGTSPSGGNSGVPGTSQAFVLLGWRQIY